MALSRVEFFSDSLKRVVTFFIYLPNDTTEEFTAGNPNYERETKTLYLLHGYTGSASDWVIGSNAMEVSRFYNVAIVMPSGENSFYIDRRGTGNAYETFVAKELPQYIAKTYRLPQEKENVTIGGLSMGGYGALRLGIKYNERFGAAFGLSSALIIKNLKETYLKEGTVENMLGDYDYYRQIFGDMDEILEKDVNLEYLVQQKLNAGEALPRLFMACGTEDSLVDNSRDFRDFLLNLKADLIYYESAGIHSWKFWNEYLEPAVRWAIGAKESDAYLS
ncbi:MAG: alpha/beta hydrolase-fold protein [Lachnospiraceae bacterium]|nr:alpha/beta hydrolase-fold protein [Lachnospiraceae bacterium]